VYAASYYFWRSINPGMKRGFVLEIMITFFPPMPPHVPYGLPWSPLPVVAEV
jgi:hypothetical protein